MRALRGANPAWGGWITGPSFGGPAEFARAGYDYVGFDIQHGYLDDAGVARELRRIEHVPIATAVRVPTCAPAPIGRVLDAGADAVIVAMVDTPAQAAEAVAAATYPPGGVRSFGPLRRSLGHDPAELQDRVGVLAMIETARGLAAVADICAVPGLAGVYVGPADLAISLGLEVPQALRHPRVREALAEVLRAATGAGVLAGVHAGDGVTGKDMAALGFQMITLASEGQSLCRGAAAHLDEARSR